MRLGDLDYVLPPERIAQHPAARREDARLLVVDRARDGFTDTTFARLGDWLRPGDALVLNETRVRPARLEVRRGSGGRVELLFVRPEAWPPDEARWRVLARPARHAAPGVRLAGPDGLVLEVVGAGGRGERIVRVRQGALEAVLRAHGAVPLPPYIRRPEEPEDRERYQTVYARVEGAVAAPTAGLHFSQALLAALAAAGVRRVPVVLHVGPGTFRPVTEADPRDHALDPEWIEVGAEAAEALRATRAAGGRIVAVGTTAVRTLEGMAELHPGGFGPVAAWTRTYILPPHAFRNVDALVTNFHLPRTTLLLLVAAFAGIERTRAAYAHAVRERYRFYSYGDAMLIV